MFYKITKKIKVLLYDIRKYLICGKKEERKYFIKKYKAQAKKLRNKIHTKKVQEELLRFEKQLESYLYEVSKHRNHTFVFMFSGTTFIQEKRGNRPIRLTNTWIEQDIPVLFSYYRWNKGEDIPKSTDNRLFQMPIDYTMEWLDKIIEYSMPDKQKIFIVSFPFPDLVRYVGKLQINGWKVIYDVRDNWEEFHKVNMAKWYKESVERFFVCQSDIVCCVAKPLQEKMQSYTNNKVVRLSPNALDCKFKIVENKMQNKFDKQLKVGYVGHLSASWFDWDSLVEVAQRKPDWIFEIIGHFEPKGMKLPQNLKLLGSKGHKEIQLLAKKWDVAIIPFTIGALSDCVDPIKIYEYLAMGLPVVSFRMPQIHDYPNTYIAHNTQEFIEQIERGVNMPFDSVTTKAFLEKNTWEIRARQLVEWATSVPNVLEDLVESR